MSGDEVPSVEEEAERLAAVDRKRVGRNLATARKAAGMTQGELADALRGRGLDDWYQSTVSRTENGLRGMRDREFDIIGAFLGVDLGEGVLSRSKGAMWLKAESRRVGEEVRIRALRHAHEALLDAEHAVRVLRALEDPDYEDPAVLERPAVEAHIRPDA